MNAHRSDTSTTAELTLIRAPCILVFRNPTRRPTDTVTDLVSPFLLDPSTQYPAAMGDYRATLYRPANVGPKRCGGLLV